MMGTGASGVDTNEAAYPNTTVYIYLWDDDGDNIVSNNETVYLSSTVTDTNGDYSFSDLPFGDGDDGYVVALAAPDDYLQLTTTTNSGTPATFISNTVNAAGETISAWGAVPITAGIITNKNGVPQDPRGPRVTSGLRLGAPAATTRGMGTAEMQRIAAWIDEVLASGGDNATIEKVRSEVRDLCEAFPLHGAQTASA